MSSTTPGGAAHREVPDNLRPLPARPSLEFERKRARKLLREMRRGDPAAKLADAQYAAAREYGFSSWPRLVEYFRILERHERSMPPTGWGPLEHFEQGACALLRRHADRRTTAANKLATFVPRFFGKSTAEVLDSSATIDDARLVIAREHRLPSWDVLIEFAQPSPEQTGGWERYESPFMRACIAIRNGDFPLLQRIVNAHPEVLQTPDRLHFARGEILWDALLNEYLTLKPESRRITDWLASRGANLQDKLNRILLSFVPMGYAVERDPSGVDCLEYMLDRGADPNWMPPNGIPVLEHMLLHARGHAAIDVIVRRVTPRKAFWIAAALGDVESLERFFDKSGRLTAAARRHRPDFVATGMGTLPTAPHASDLDLMWEAFFIAAMNERFNSLDLLLDRGLPIDYAPWGGTLLSEAINGRSVHLVEYLLERGASLDIAGASPEKLDEWLFISPPSYPGATRIYELCGGKNAEGVIRRYETGDVREPELAPRLAQALEAAKDDAARLGQTEVHSENLFIALFCDEMAPPVGVVAISGVDPTMLRRSIEHRLVAGSSPHPDLPLGADAVALVAEAKEMARRMRRVHVDTPHLLAAIVRDNTGPAVEILVAAGGDMAKLRKELGKQ